MKLFLGMMLVWSCASRAQALAPACFQTETPMNLEFLKQKAFERCQGGFHRPLFIPIPLLDPPRLGGVQEVGLVYQEELAIRTKNLLDKNGFYFSPRPRAAVNTLPMDIFVKDGEQNLYQRKTWYDAEPDFSSPLIQPSVDITQIPDEGRVLTELIVGHRSPQGDYPQLFDIRSSAYLRFAGYPPQIMGASLRLGAHKIFGMEADDRVSSEEFPIIREMYVGIQRAGVAEAYVLVENELFCGALKVDMREGEDAVLVVDGYYYFRHDHLWQASPHTALVAFSSMLWKNETHTPERISDEAHDSDTLRIRYRNGTRLKHLLEVPSHGVQVREFPQAQEWILANEDRDPAHYADFAPALGHTNYGFRASYKVEVLHSSVRHGVSLYESKPDGEYADNIVVASTLRENIPRSTRADQFVHFKYRVTSFLVEP